MKPRSRKFRLGEPAGSVKLARWLLKKSSIDVNPVSPVGNVRFVNELFSILSVVRFVKPAGMMHCARGLKLKSRIARFVNVPGSVKLVTEFPDKFNKVKLRAASSPVRSLIFRLPACSWDKLSKSWAVNDPLVFCSVKRIAASSPGSGMDIFCARADVTSPAKARVRSIILMLNTLV